MGKVMPLKRKIVRLACFLAGAYGVLVLLGCCVPNHLMFYPPAYAYQLDTATELIATPDGEKLAVAFYPPQDTNALIILFSHGNAENLGQMRPVLEEFNARGYGVCAYDYRGYGLSTGKPSEKNCYADVKTVYTWLTRDKGIPPGRIVSYGRSLGGAMAILIASEQPVSGLILESAFVTALRVISRVPLLPFDVFTNNDKILRIACPVYIMHGTADKIIPVWHGRKLYELAPGPKRAWWVEGAGHNNLLQIGGMNYFTGIESFLNDMVEKETGTNDIRPSR
jgi:fermentation-respiration switch protein FrsA (DUF1100 family)